MSDCTYVIMYIRTVCVTCIILYIYVYIYIYIKYFEWDILSGRIKEKKSAIFSIKFQGGK